MNGRNCCTNDEEMPLLSSIERTARFAAALPIQTVVSSNLEWIARCQRKSRKLSHTANNSVAYRKETSRGLSPSQGRQSDQNTTKSGCITSKHSLFIDLDEKERKTAISILNEQSCIGERCSQSGSWRCLIRVLSTPPAEVQSS